MDMQTISNRDVRVKTPFQQDGETSLPPQTEYDCSIEWHLARLVPLAALIYGFGSRISRKSGRFFCSAGGLAEYFGYNEKQVRRAFDALVKSGFFIVLEKRPFTTTVYSVVSHQAWAALHSGRCAARLSFPWSAEGEALGRDLYARSGGKLKFRPYQIGLIRDTGFDDARIGAEFCEFWRLQVRPKCGKQAVYTFLDHLRIKFATEHDD
jgi:hypothetical protein